MPTTIKCPSCQHEFPLEEAVSEEYKKELREQMVTYKKQKEEEMQRKEQEWKQETAKREADLKKELEETMRKNITADYETKLRLLEQNDKDNQEKLKAARQKEADFLRKEQDLKNKEAELEITVQKQLQQEREKLSEELRKIEEQKVAARENEFQLRLKELEKQLEDQKKLAEEMKRKAEQGSMQLQGESQELLIQETLQNFFPFDLIEEIGKGQRGADCIQIVRNNQGQECGKIYYESKRAEKFAGDWIEKLKADMRRLGTDVGVIVTKTLPKDVNRFGQKDGIWICTISDLTSMAYMLRDGILKIFAATKSQENKGDKMTMLYNYLTSSEFSEQWKAIREGFMSMKLSIQKERDAMEKLWKQREKQLEKVLLNAAHIQGSVEGISGMDAVDLNLLTDTDDEDDLAH